MVYYQIDGSFEGLLTAVFEAFERKQFDIRVCTIDDLQLSAFDEVVHIATQEQKAQRVKLGLQNILPADKMRLLFVAYLSEGMEILTILFYMICEVFKKNPNIFYHYGDERVMRFTQTVKSVEREKHRMKAFIRFQKSNDGMFFCVVKPDFNVLPLISDFFRKRYADQRWLIYDEKRKYGLLYDLKQVHEVAITKPEAASLSNNTTTIELDDEEQKYATLWKDYFKSTNIESRRNIKLHLQHVPKRYWKYLTEKNLTPSPSPQVERGERRSLTSNPVSDGRQTSPKGGEGS